MAPASMPFDTGGNDQARSGDSAVEGLLRIASAARLVRSPDGQLFASVPLKNRHEVFGLRSRGFRDWLLESFRAQRGGLPAEWAFRRALWSVEAQARFDEESPALHVRVGRECEGSGQA